MQTVKAKDQILTTVLFTQGRLMTSSTLYTWKCKWMVWGWTNSRALCGPDALPDNDL